MKNGFKIVLSIFGLLLIIGLFVFFLPKHLPEDYPKNLSEVITPAQANMLLKNNDLPDQKIRIRGNLTKLGDEDLSKTFMLTGGDISTGWIEVNLNNNLSDEEVYNFLVENKLAYRGIVEVEIEGILTKGECCQTMNSHTDIVTLFVEPKDIRFIKEGGCPDNVINCFNITYKEKIELNYATSKLEKSEICLKKLDDIEVSTAKYDYIDASWIFSVYPGEEILGCSEQCVVSGEDIKYIRSCSPGYNYPKGYDLVLTEKDGVNYIEKYSECLNDLGLKTLPPAKDESIGAVRIDKEGINWTKSKEISGYTYDERGNEIAQYCWKNNMDVGSCLGDILIDEQPNGIYDPQVLGCNSFYDPLSR